ncbi:TerB N-terminal domain-containing protein [Paucidesulfovibrio longus]|uniref:TerB N-terminal domain-containing protein n=1 Tax=Paucidesulfovibrio longus TaxID=889 RepID=UPI000411C11D|nr:TerB N-terminal domain-containing protein [Paucidesulfovibrio longus]
MIEIVVVVAVLILCAVGFAIKRKYLANQNKTTLFDQESAAIDSPTKNQESDLYSDKKINSDVLESDKVSNVAFSQELTDFKIDCCSNFEDSTEDCWILPGRDIVVGDRNIKSGMIYVKGLLSTKGKDENSAELIDLRLKRDPSGAYFKEYNLHSWRSYSNISPKARGAYINWLADGRPIDEVRVGYINMFFSGLERRVLGEKPKKNELESIANEVKRLMSDCQYNTYIPEYDSFCNRAKKFLQYIKLEINDWMHTTVINYNHLGKEVFPVTFVMALGRMVEDKKPLPWELALEWSFRYLKNRIRKPAKQCPSELALLFKKRYLDKFGEGLVVSQYEKREVVLYYPVNPSIGNSVVQVSDASNFLDTYTELRLIIDSCLEQLDSLSRFKSKVKLSEHTLMSYALLPHEIVCEFEPNDLNQLRHICEISFEDGAEIANISVDTITDLWMPTDRRMSHTDSQLLAVVLDRIGYGMEPDVRYMRPLKTIGKGICIFNNSNAHEALSNMNFELILVVAHLSALVALANGKNHHGKKYVLNQLKLFLSLNSTEEKRTTAYFEWVFEFSPSLTGLKPLVNKLDESERKKILSFLLGIIGGDGIIHSDEINMLEKAYKTLGLNSAGIQNSLHRLLTMNEGQPVVVKEATSEDHNYSIPSVPIKGDHVGVELDAERLQARQKQTLEVVRLLDEVFVAEEFKPEPYLEEPNLLGLDSLHMNLLRRLSERDTWDYFTFENIAGEYGLMPSGALETINDAALGYFDDEVLIDEEDVIINRDVIERMLS